MNLAQNLVMQPRGGVWFKIYITKFSSLSRKTRHTHALCIPIPCLFSVFPLGSPSLRSPGHHQNLPPPHSLPPTYKHHRRPLAAASTLTAVEIYGIACSSIACTSTIEYALTFTWFVNELALVSWHKLLVRGSLFFSIYGSGGMYSKWINFLDWVKM